jgi:K+-sensing histidine kinase KdpD
MIAVRAVWRGVSIPQLMILAALCAYAVTFALLVNYGRPGLGISGGFYVAVILVAAATSPFSGVLAACAAVVLLLLVGPARGHGFAWTDIDHASILTHLAGYTAAGILTGFLAVRVRRMLAQSLYVLEDLIELAHDREPERTASTLP